jgi:hypothetical protein
MIKIERKSSPLPTTPTSLRLVPVVGYLYLSLNHVTSAFSFPLDHQHSSSLHHLAHSHINISHLSLLSPSQHHHFRIYFVDNEFEKAN